MLAVTVTIAAVLTPSITDFILDSKLARAQSDCRTIASAIALFQLDNGFYPFWTRAENGGPGLPGNRLKILVGPGDPPLEEQPSEWTSGAAGLLSEQLVENTPGYRRGNQTSQFGWRGSYLASEIYPDPWGHRYVVNIELLNASASATAARGGVKAAVWVLSAGPNGVIETPFWQSIMGADLRADDIGVRFQ